jgi:hypothetical protein
MARAIICCGSWTAAQSPVLLASYAHSEAFLSAQCSWSAHTGWCAAYAGIPNAVDVHSRRGKAVGGVEGSAANKSSMLTIVGAAGMGSGVLFSCGTGTAWTWTGTGSGTRMGSRSGVRRHGCAAGHGAENRDGGGRSASAWSMVDAARCGWQQVGESRGGCEVDAEEMEAGTPIVCMTIGCSVPLHTAPRPVPVVSPSPCRNRAVSSPQCPCTRVHACPGRDRDELSKFWRPEGKVCCPGPRRLASCQRMATWCSAAVHAPPSRTSARDHEV